MIDLIFILKYILHTLGALLLAFLLASSISSLRHRYQILKKGWKIKYRIFIGAVFCFFIALSLGIPQEPVEAFKIGDYIETLQSPTGALIQKASKEGFEEEVKNTAPKARDDARNHFYAAEDDLIHQRYHEAAANYQKSLNVLETVSAHMNLGVVLRLISELEGAEDSWMKGLAGARMKKIRVYEAGLTSNIGEIQTISGDSELGLESLETALNLSRTIGDKKGEAACLGNIGNIFADMGRPEKAMLYYNTAMDIAVGEGDRMTEAILRVNIGGAYQNMGDSQKSLDNYLEAVRIFKDLGEYNWGGIPIDNIEYVYNEDGGPANGESGASGENQGGNNLDQALEFHETALELNKEMDNKAGEAENLGYLGSIYTLQEDYTKARSYLEKAQDINQETGNRAGEALNLGNIGSVHLLNDDLDTALDYYEKALEINLEINNEKEITANLANIGGVYALKGDIDMALGYYNYALEISSRLNMDAMTKQIETNIAQLEMET